MMPLRRPAFLGARVLAAHTCPKVRKYLRLRVFPRDRVSKLAPSICRRAVPPPSGPIHTVSRTYAPAMHAAPEHIDRAGARSFVEARRGQRIRSRLVHVRTRVARGQGTAAWIYTAEHRTAGVEARRRRRRRNVRRRQHGNSSTEPRQRFLSTRSPPAAVATRGQLRRLAGRPQHQQQRTCRSLGPCRATGAFHQPSSL